MPVNGDIYLGIAGSETLVTANGRKFSIKNKRIAREGRAASGMLRRDIVATKKNITLDYSLIGTTDLSWFIWLDELNTELSLLVYTSDVDHEQYDVLMSPLDRTRLLLAGDGLWEGVTVELREI